MNAFPDNIKINCSQFFGIFRRTLKLQRKNYVPMRIENRELFAHCILTYRCELTRKQLAGRLSGSSCFLVNS